jgi:endonuclease/exonuclease/phosphatase family metal-dependent hydrolase
VRFLTFNIHHAEGTDSVVRPRRIADTIAALTPDVVGLQEVRRGTLLGNQPDLLSRRLRMEREFQPTVRVRGYDYGNLLLTRGKILSAEHVVLPSSGAVARGCLLARVELDGARIAVAVTHLGVRPADLDPHLELLLEVLPSSEPLVLLGDFNATAAQLAPLGELLTLPADSPPTFPAQMPVAAIDLVGFSRHWRLTSLTTMRTVASDHLPLVAELELA